MTLTPLTHDDPEAAAFFADVHTALNPPPPRPPLHPKAPEPVAEEPDLSDLTGMPPSTPPDRRLLQSRSWLGTGIYLAAADRHEAAALTTRAAAAQAEKDDPVKVVRLLAIAENTAPSKDKPWHAARLDAYAAAHGVRGWFRRQGRDGTQVSLMALRTWQAGNRGRYYVNESQGLPRPALPHLVADRDTGNVVYRTHCARIARQWVDEHEAL